MRDRAPLIACVLILIGLDLLMLQLFDVLQLPPLVIFALPVAAAHVLIASAFWPGKK